MKKYLFIISIILMLCTAFGTGWTTDYYVRPHVTDAACTYGSCDGTSYANAWEGFSGGDGTAVNWTTVDLGPDSIDNNTDDGILFIAGTHNEQIGIGRSGEAAYPIILKSYQANPAIMDLQDTGAQVYIIGLTASYVTVDGLTIKRSPQSGIRISGSNWEVKNCVIYDNGVTDDISSAHGLAMVAGSGHLIHDNQIYRNHTHGIFFWPSTNSISDVSIYNNFIGDNYHSNIDIQSTNYESYTYDTTNIRIYNNLIRDSDGCLYSRDTGPPGVYIYGYTADAMVSDIDIYYNIFDEGCGSGIYVDDGYEYNINIYNNTFYNGYTVATGWPAGISLNESVSTSINIINNIITDYEGRGIIVNGASTPVIIYNLLDDNALGNFSDGYSPDASNILNSDPMFVADGSDFRLSPYSSARNSGLPLSGAYENALDPTDTTFPYDTVKQWRHGSGWEIGAFAYVVTDYEGNKIYGNIDIGALEWSPFQQGGRVIIKEGSPNF